MASVFVSYSWDNDAHKNWVKELATRLRSDGIDVTLDRWHLIPGDQLPEFMERAVRDSDHVLVVCTRRYKTRSDSRTGGVGYEGDIMTGSVLSERNRRKFIPLLREGPWEGAAPNWLIGAYYLDFSASPYDENSYEDLRTTLLGVRPTAPELGKPSTSGVKPKVSAGEATPGARDDFEEIRITGVIVDEVGTPRNDGTAGSALYTVPFQLTGRPPPGWAELFVNAWNYPTRYTSMHRPGIASVSGDKVILDGTTVEEVNRYHKDTLVLATQEANKGYQAVLGERRAEREREKTRREEHRKTVINEASKIKFD